MIGDQTKDLAGVFLSRLFVSNWDKIKEAYIKSDDALAVSLSLNFSEKNGKVKVEAGISFVESRVKEKLDAEIVEQPVLFK